MILKLGIQHWGLKLYKVYINDDPGLTLTYFTARSNCVSYTFESGKLIQSHFMGENMYRLNNTVNEKRIDPQGLSAPGPGDMINVYDNCFLISSRKLHGKSMPHFILSLLGKGE